MDEISIKTEAGEIVLKKPTAGIRNKALVKGDTPEGFKRSVMMIELLPLCIKSHPWGMTSSPNGVSPIRITLDNLSIEDYDKLIDGLEELMGKGAEIKKKLTDTSDQGEEAKSGSSDSSSMTTTTPSK